MQIFQKFKKTSYQTLWIFVRWTKTKGCNNKIKVLKRNAYDYRDFKRFRNRILHIFSHQKLNLLQKQATACLPSLVYFNLSFWGLTQLLTLSLLELPQMIFLICDSPFWFCILYIAFLFSLTIIFIIVFSLLLNFRQVWDQYIYSINIASPKLKNLYFFSTAIL